MGIPASVNLLLVDDEPRNLVALEAVLEPLGVNLVRATSGHEALQRIATADFAAVVLDVRMPVMDGFEAAKRIRTLPRSKTTPIIFLTAADREEFAEEEAYALGAVDFLTKPISSAVLKAKVAFFIDLFRKSEELKAAERARADDRVRESELRVRLAVELAGVGYWEWDLLTDVCLVDETCAALFEVGTETSGKETFRRIHPDDRERVGAAVQVAVDGTGPYDSEFRVIRGDGSVRWLSGRGNVVRDPSGKAVRLVGVNMDVSDRACAVLRVRESEERFKTAVAATSEIIWTNDSSGQMTGDQPGWSAYTGQTPEQYRGYGWSAALHPDDVRQTIEIWERAVAERSTFICEHRVRRHDGVYRQFSVRALPVMNPDGTVREWVGTHTDITDRKRVEEHLAKAAEAEKHRAVLLSRLAAASQQVHGSLSADEIVAIVNEQARSIIGASHAVTSLFDGKGMHAAGRSLGPNRLAVPLVGHGGGNIGIIRLSDKAAGEFTEEDQAVLSQLAAIASVAIENARLYDSLRDANKRKDEFLATLAHELRNPLAPIRNGLHVLRMSPNSGDQLLGMMERQLGHLVHLVDDLLDVSRVTSGKITLRLEPLELREVIDAAVETSRPGIEAAGHAFTVRLPKEPLFLEGDRTRLAQVITNILNNAGKYTPEGGRIDLTAERDGGNVVIRVVDTGVGIPADMLPKVFDVFTQVGRSLDRSQGGLGLGLALVQRLVEMHGGSVRAESAGPGKGSTFTVRLPLNAGCGVRNAESKPDFDSAFRTPRSAIRTVLVVDDNTDAAESLAELLRIAGHRTETAASGPEAVQKAKALRPDVVFLDIGLPGMSGYEVAGVLRTDPGLAATALVAVTGWGTDEDQRKAREAGFHFHLTKPAEVEKVFDLFHRLPQPAGLK